MRKLILFVGLALCGCYSDSIDFGLHSDQSYLPLEVGNSWDFRPLGSSGDATIHREVVGTINREADGHTYYLLVTTSLAKPPALPIRPDTAYYRIDDDGYVYILRDYNNYVDKRFKLNAKNGNTWTYPVDDHSNAKITVTVSSVEVGSTTIANCKSYYYDVLNWADEENTITLAPGIGFVKEYGAWGLGQILTSAKIHGHAYNF